MIRYCSAYHFCFIFLLLLCCTLSDTLPFVAFYNRSQNLVPPTFSLRWLQRFPQSTIIGHPLLFDSDLDGFLDVFFATVDGTLFGVPSVLSHPATMGFLAPRASWSVSIRGEHFISSPIPVSVDSQGHSLLLLASDHGTLFVFDDLGNRVTHIQIPDILVSLGTSIPPDMSILISPRHLANHVKWANNQSDDGNTWRLSPKVYTTPTVLTAPGAQLPLDSLDSDCLVISVTFVSPTSQSHGFVLAALVGLRRVALLSSGLWGSSSLDLASSLTLVPLELGFLNQSTPPYLFSRPVVLSSPLGQSSLSLPTFSLLVTVFSGRLYKVPLPLGRGTSTPDVLWNISTPSTSVSLPCVPVNCPTVSHSGITFSSYSQLVPRLCCLLLDDTSCLRLIDVSYFDKHIDHPSRRLRWKYSPHSDVFQTSMHMQLGHPSIVTVDCDNQAQDTCKLWVVYPTQDGFIHAADLRTGTPIAGYPIRLFVPETPTEENASSVGLRTFASGPGLTYTAPDSSLWMVFADTLGQFYHIQIRTNPVVLAPKDCVFGCDHKPDRRFFPVNNWLTPVPVYRKSAFSPSETEMALLFIDTTGLGLLTVNRPALTLTTERSPSRGSFEFHAFDAVFLDSHGHSVDIIHMDSVHQSVRYALRNCLRRANASHPIPYAVRLVDSSGAPVSDWSTPTFSESFTQHVSNNYAYCHGTLTLNRPVYGSFRSRVHLIVIQTETGYLLSSFSQAHSYPDVSSSVVLDFHTSWPQIFRLWIYLPLAYAILGCFFLHLSTEYRHISCSHPV